MPAPLAQRGVLGVEVIAKQSRFELRAHPWNSDPPPTEFRFLGTVSSEASGSRVEVQVGVLGVARMGKWAFVAIAAAVFVTRGSGGFWALAIAGGSALMDFVRERSLVRGSDPVVELYFDLLRGALEPDAKSGAGAV